MSLCGWFPCVGEDCNMLTVERNLKLQDRIWKEGGRKGVNVTADMEDKKRSVEEKQEDAELIPGIQNDITLRIMASKPSWRDIQALSSVSHGWQQAIKSREVYNARIRTHSTETFAVLSHYNPEGEIGKPGIRRLGLYSIRDKYWQNLPSMPFHGGILTESQCISLDGKIYILGGVKQIYDDLGSKEVFVLDVAGKGEWKRCASMNQPRAHFGAGVLNGKIYVFGGVSSRRQVLECEVYDPKVGVWSPITPMTGRTNPGQHPLNHESRVNHKVGIVGEELFVYGGQFFWGSLSTPIPEWEVYDPVLRTWSPIKPLTDSTGPAQDPLSDEGRVYHEEAIFYYDGEFYTNFSELMDPENEKLVDHPIYSHIDEAKVLEAYHPITDEWRQIVPSEERDWDNVFMAKGKFHELRTSGISFYDIEKDSWSPPDLVGSLPEGLSTCPDRVGPSFTTAVGDELLLHNRLSFDACGKFFYESRGFGNGNNQISWERANCSPKHYCSRSPFACTIEL